MVRVPRQPGGRLARRVLARPFALQERRVRKGQGGLISRLPGVKPSAGTAGETMKQSNGESPFAQGSPELAGVVHRNIRALLEVRKEFERRKRLDERIADAVTGFAGSMYSVLLHALFFGGWIIVNLGRVPGVR